MPPPSIVSLLPPCQVKFRRSFLAAEALAAYLDVNEWHVAGIKQAVASMDRDGGVPHDQVRSWIESWDGGTERAVPTRRKS
jgi:predicted transcriptional regulator